MVESPSGILKLIFPDVSSLSILTTRDVLIDSKLSSLNGDSKKLLFLVTVEFILETLPPVAKPTT